MGSWMDVRQRDGRWGPGDRVDNGRWASRGSRQADLGLGHRPLGHVGLEAPGRVVEEEAHAEWREALVRALVHVGPAVQQPADDVSVAVNLAGEGPSARGKAT